jgi:hypothetical protein
MTPELREASIKAMQVITTDGRHLSGGRAMLFALEGVDWHPRLMRLLSHRPLIWPVELGYRIFARNRSRFARFFPPE